MRMSFLIIFAVGVYQRCCVIYYVDSLAKSKGSSPPAEGFWLMLRVTVAKERLLVEQW